ncbi:MAG: ROK family glucokinase [Corynebacterium sp.]|nr:ROK family glucokinase [Corynebacterium sp.]
MSEASIPASIGFDIGGTNLRAGVVNEHGRIIDSESLHTADSVAELEAGIVRLVDSLSVRHPVEAVGLAVAGFLDPDCSTVRFAPHLPWRDAPVKDILEQRLGLPVRLEHDANSAAWAESQFGAGRGAQDWVFFAIGTGIGATLMSEGEIYRGAYGTAPEFGHIQVVPNGRECSCGKRGCLERYASGTALAQTAQELRGQFTTALAPDASGEDIVAAARLGDELAKAVMDDFAQWLGLGLSMVCDILDPELIVLGGGVSKEADLYLDKTRAVMESSVVGAGHRPLARVATATLGWQAGMIGAADLARRELAKPDLSTHSVIAE